jgi:hypothetical protein
MYVKLLPVYAWHTRSYPNSCRLCCNGCLVTSTVVRLTSAELKPLIFLCRASLFRCRERLPFRDFLLHLLVAITMSLRNHNYKVLRKICLTRGPVYLVGPRYITSRLTAQRTPLPAVLLMLDDIASGADRIGNIVSDSTSVGDVAWRDGLSRVSEARVEVGSDTSTETLRVVGSYEKGTQCLEV